MINTHWTQLPNVEQVNRVIADVAKRPNVWATAWLVTQSYIDTAIRKEARIGARALLTSCPTTSAAWAEAKVVTPLGISQEVQGVTRDYARYAALDAVLALMVFPYCANYWFLPPGALKPLIYKGNPAAILLQPAVEVFNLFKDDTEDLQQDWMDEQDFELTSYSHNTED